MVAAEAEESPRRPRLPSPAEKRTSAAAAPSSDPTTTTNTNNNSLRRSLHNFSFPPTLSWGNQRVLRCVNVSTSAGGDITASPTPNLNKSSSPDSDPKPQQQLQQQPKRTEEEAESSPARPWNLRTRRANPNRIANNNPNPNPNPNSNQSQAASPITIPSPNLNRSSSSSPSPPAILQPAEKSNSVKAGRSEGGEESDKGERCKFVIALGREEIEEDFLKIKGSKPPRRPKKRAKYIQRQLDSLFPGLWLSEITPDLYKIEVEKT